MTLAVIKRSGDVMKKIYKLLTVGSLFSILVGCGGDDGLSDDNTIRDYSGFFTALPEQAIYPENNKYSKDKSDLGELLFWDPILSGNQNVACASCHHPEFGWADGREFSIGSDGIGLGPDRHGDEVTPIHSPTVMNVAFTGISVNNNPDNFTSGAYFWDLRADTLEDQAIGPIKNKVEMLGYNFHEDEIMTEVVNRLSSVDEYVDLFSQAFEDEESINKEVINEKNIAKALATFQRKITTSNSRFDKFLNGQTDAFSETEIIGLNTFIDGGCVTCHSGPMLSDNLIREDEKIIDSLDAVRTPSLRNITKTAPYMQDGSRDTLARAISIYEDRGDIGVSAGEDDFADLEIFLRTLDASVYSHIPTRVPSGLPVGGDISQ